MLSDAFTSHCLIIAEVAQAHGGSAGHYTTEGSSRTTPDNAQRSRTFPSNRAASSPWGRAARPWDHRPGFGAECTGARSGPRKEATGESGAHLGTAVRRCRG